VAVALVFSLAGTSRALASGWVIQQSPQPAGSITTTLAGLSSAAPTGDINCAALAPAGSTTFIGKITAAHDLIVPSGTGCGPTQGSTIGHDVIIEKGGWFFPGGTRIGYDVRASQALMVELGDPNNGTTFTKVGHDVIIDGTEGPVPDGNFICQTRIGHDLVVENSSAKASGFDVGYPDRYNCGRNSNPAVFVGHDATFSRNANSLEVGDLTVGRALTFTYNSGPNDVLWGIASGSRCYQAHNRHLGMRGGNSVRHGRNNCGAVGWSIQPIAPGAAGWGSSSVSCASPRDCLAGGQVGGVGHWNGTNWSLDRELHVLAGSPDPYPSPWVSCIPGRGCVVVGGDAPRGSGARWSIPSFPASIDLSYSSSLSLSCASPTACTAFGLLGPEGETTSRKQVVERWNGKKWSIQPTPKVGLGDSFSSVSCSSVTTCMLVGSYEQRARPAPPCCEVASVGIRTLTERWNGTKWSLLRSPNPGDAGCPVEAGRDLPFCYSLSRVSCASLVACVAIGSYGGHGYLALIERWNGKKWSSQRLPNIGTTILTGVSCASATACTVVGTNSEPIALRWNGKRWSVQHLASNGDPYDVSCPTPTYCTAVGFGISGPMAESWTGRG
jgi:hypothetical protein